MARHWRTIRKRVFVSKLFSPAGSIRFLLHAGELHHAAPFLDFRPDEGTKLLRRTWLRHDADCCVLLAERGALEYRDDLAVKLLHDSLRRAARRIDAIPGARFDTRHPAFSKRGNLRCERRSGCCRSPERSQLACAHLR